MTKDPRWGAIVLTPLIVALIGGWKTNRFAAPPICRCPVFIIRLKMKAVAIWRNDALTLIHSGLLEAFTRMYSVNLSCVTLGSLGLLCAQ